MDNAQDLYSILGVPSGASAEDIQAAYRSIARRLNPDANPHAGAATQFKDIAAAYQTLTDPFARSRYDSAHLQMAASDRTFFTLRVTPSKRVLPILEEQQVLYMLVEVLPERSRNLSPSDIHLNLTLVIDHSTSMSGLRLERTRAAAFQIIDQLSEHDILSLVSFSDKAEVLVPASTVSDKSALKALVAMMQASGGTEIYQGLEAGFKENTRHAGKKYINHMILLTDGRTYGDEQISLELAAKAARSGIGISAMGIGEEWNDAFLDQIASRTGGTSEYISSPNAVVAFLNNRVRALGRSLAERVSISLAPDSDIKIESAFRLTPSPQPVAIESDPILLGQLQVAANTSILFQLQVPVLPREGFRSLMRIDVTADIIREQRPNYKVIADTAIEISASPPVEEPPLAILDALGKLTLYRMQEKAEQALARGDIQEATKRLETLATRLLTAGQEDLANAAMSEARRVAATNMLSEEGRKQLKYGTRMLIGAAEQGGATKSINPVSTG